MKGRTKEGKVKRSTALGKTLQTRNQNTSIEGKLSDNPAPVKWGPAEETENAALRHMKSEKELAKQRNDLIIKRDFT